MELTPEIEARLRELSDATLAHRNRRREHKLALLEEFKVCWWCDTPVRDYGNTDGSPPPPDMATVDHLVSRFFRRKHDNVLKVLACNKCNQKRSRAENKIYTGAHLEKLKNAALEQQLWERDVNREEPELE